MHGDHLAHAEDVHRDRPIVLDRLKPVGLFGSEDHLELTFPQASIAFLELGEIVDLHVIEQGPPAEINLVGRECDPLARSMVLEDEGSGPDRMGRETMIAEGLDRLAADDETAGVIGNLGEEQNRGKWLFEHKVDGEVIDFAHRHTFIIAGISRHVGVRRAAQ